MSQKRQKTTIGLVLGLLLLGGMAVPATLAGPAGGSALQITDFRATGNLVSVTVTNTDAAYHQGYVVVDVRLDNSTVQAVAVVKLQGGSTTTATVSFGSPVDGVIAVGISEDPMPV